MNHTIHSQTNIFHKQTIWLIIGDIVALLAFTWAGLSSHQVSITNIERGLITAVPLMIGWFLVAPWFGLYQEEIRLTARKFIPRMLLGWVLIGGPIALVLRALWLGRSIPGGIPLTFVAVTLSVTTIFLLIWRLGYIWWIGKRRGEQ